MKIFSGIEFTHQFSRTPFMSVRDSVTRLGNIVQNSNRVSKEHCTSVSVMLVVWTMTILARLGTCAIFSSKLK